MTIKSKLLKIIFFSLIVASLSLLLLYILFWNILIKTQENTAELIANDILAVKYSNIGHYKAFENIISNYKKFSNLDVEVYSLIHYSSLFKEYKEKINANFKNKITLKYFEFIKPIKIKPSCLACHGQVIRQEYNCKDIKHKKNKLLGYKEGDIIGILKIKIPIKDTLFSFFKSVIFITLILLIALLLTIYSFLKFGKLVEYDILKLIKFFKEKISKRIYDPLKAKMNFLEFEELKKEINNAVGTIKYYYQEMLKKTYENPLTNLPNRNKLQEDLEKEKFYLGLLDINDFREINNYFGQKIGDELLKNVALKLKELVNSPYHISADRFAIKLPFKEKDKNKKYICDILDTLETSYFIDNNEFVLTFRAGLSKEKNDPLQTAEIALDFAKIKKLKCLCFSDIEYLKEIYKKNLEVLNDIVYAIKNKKVKVFYQPIIDNKTEEIVKYEALMRIENKDGKILSPVIFLDVAKKTNLYFQLTQIMFDQVIKTLQQNDINVSINLSVLDIENEELNKKILDRLKICKKVDKITIELLENEDISSSFYAKNFLNELKKLGVKIYIDDFGSGFSNFSYIFNFNIDGIKIDGSLIKNIIEDKKSQMIIETMVEFARKGNIKTVAEFVENEEIFKKVKELGVDYSQGYFFSKPKPFDIISLS